MPTTLTSREFNHHTARAKRAAQERDIAHMQVFDQVFVLTGGGPGTATKYLVQYIYETGFAAQIPRRGLASAASVLLGGVLMLFTLVQLWLGRKTEVT